MTTRLTSHSSGLPARLRIITVLPDDLTKGSTYTERYRFGNITAQVTYVVVKKYPEGAAYTATVVVTKGIVARQSKRLASAADKTAPNSSFDASGGSVIRPAMLD